MKRMKNCSKCGCDRYTLVTATVLRQTKDVEATLKTMRVCLPCFIEGFTDIIIRDLPIGTQKSLYKMGTDNE